MTKLKSLNFLWLLMIVPLMFLFTGCGDKSVSQLNKTASCETQAETAYSAVGAGDAYAEKITKDEDENITNDFSKGYRMTLKMGNGDDSLNVNAIVVDKNMAMKIDENYAWIKDGVVYARGEREVNGKTEKFAVKYAMPETDIEALLATFKASYSAKDFLSYVKGNELKVAGENSFKIEITNVNAYNFYGKIFFGSEPKAVPMAMISSTFSADIYINFNSDKTIKSMKVVINSTEEGVTTTMFELTMSEYNGSITFPKDSDFKEDADFFVDMMYSK